MKNLRLLYYYITYMYHGCNATQTQIGEELGLHQSLVSVLCQYAGLHYHVLQPRLETVEHFTSIPEIAQIADKIEPEVWERLERLV